MMGKNVQEAFGVEKTEGGWRIVIISRIEECIEQIELLYSGSSNLVVENKKHAVNIANYMNWQLPGLERMRNE
jgi:hypothetical protein